MSSEQRESSPPRNVDSSIASESNNVAKVPTVPITRPSIEEKLTSKMFSYAREIICFCLAIIFTALAAFHSSPPRVSKPPSAKPFFNQSSIVLDFYKGHLGAMIEQVINSDFSFVMYYAPWDAESQAVREEFEAVAQYYHTQIFFAAINCWHPNSECRTQYNKIQSYPVLMLYPSSDSGIQYRGIQTAPYMIRFLDAFINPLVRITSKEQLIDLFVYYDAVLVGFFNFTSTSKGPGYKEFYKSAIRSLERDPNRELAFAVVTDAKSAKNYGIVEFPSASLFMWDETLNYPEENQWTPENILNWVSNTIHQPALWLQPPGVKSHTLSPYMKEGPVLFLFTPRNPLHRENYNYNLIREVALQCYGSEKNVLVKELIARLKHNREHAKAQHSDKTKYCMDILHANKIDLAKSESDISISVQQWINDSCCSDIFINKCLLCKKYTMSPLEKQTAVCLTDSGKLGQVCRRLDVFKSFNSANEKEQQFSFCCYEEKPEKVNQRGRSRKPAEANDRRSANSIREIYFKEDCKRWLTGNEYHQPIFPRDLETFPNISFIDDVCKMNKTFALIAIDSIHYSHFAQSLGIDALNVKDKTSVVILDSSQESQYIMKEDFSRYALIKFINNYTKGFLQRTLRSDNTRHFIKKFKNDAKSSNTEEQHIEISELNTENFLDTVLDPKKDVVIMYHSPYCGFCSAIAYVFLTVAHFFSKMDHLIFVRIDGDNNDLPWEYNMNHFPSILFFPARRR
ncbi:thioredoxin domain-containing protein 11-like isoform X2 [Prorops nasuta]|uniref:thioredoxin domain-containing protein 11-like isoform X2 n=1 Tax=Prorops nasuta TaxID=863751 RepID=UPI0034CD4C30